MKADEQYRIVIPKRLREISSIEEKHIVALMMKDENLFYLVPKEEYYRGKFIGLYCMDDKGRICLRKVLEGREEKNIILYVENSKIHFKLID